MSILTDLGYNPLLTRSILPQPVDFTLTSADVKNVLPSGSVDSARVGDYSRFTTDIVFSATDNDTAAWTTGTISFATGETTPTIAASNTGNITATTFVYYDGTQTGSLQTTTTASKAIGKQRTLIAIVEKVTDTSKLCKITPIFATGLVVSDLTADQISVNQLDAVATNTGTLAVDEYITVGGNNVKIDGANGRLTVNDGSNDRVYVGSI
ncbi:hypothetical protein KC614_04480 [candidate division WWE3 bacterium]|uniref:Uncharacterized protein n=1 Tax=candidate division WWE3 bacterium TaxID=2053526 RepID=A0A955RRD2_UNCKA|nr:hypothetical protein [candidate division WWE3 bacterium]